MKPDDSPTYCFNCEEPAGYCQCPDEADEEIYSEICDACFINEALCNGVCEMCAELAPWRM